MRRTILACLALAAGILAAAAQAPAAYRPGPYNIELPPDLQARFIRYATVDKADRKIIRHMYVNPETYAATCAGQPAPRGTLLIMADARARLDASGKPLLDTSGRFIPEPGWIAIGAQGKEAGWGEGYGAGVRRNISMNACFACHLQARQEQDFNFTYWDHAEARR